jgi:hypothetical protein
MGGQAPLIEEDKAFLARLAPAKRRTTFAKYVFDYIRGWTPAGEKLTDARLILCYVHDALSRYAEGTDEQQWSRAITTHWDEAQRYLRWCLAWEQRTKAEKDAYRRQQYQAYKRAMAST